MSSWTIGRLAKQTGIATETLRYYEKRGLIEPAQRTASGYRLYEPMAARRLHFIRRAQALGFSLHEIGELLALSDDPGKNATEVKNLTRVKVADIEARIQDLERMKAGLIALYQACPGRGSTHDCPILSALNSEPN